MTRVTEMKIRREGKRERKERGRVVTVSTKIREGCEENERE